MMKYYIKTYITVICVVSWSAFVVSCANIGSPSGGDYDFDPPKLLKTNPKQNATRVKTNKITFEFDENIVLVEQNDKVIITPPQQKLPEVSSANKKISVTLRDSLQENTTYTIDFTDAITDNNEGNEFDNFSYSFSTGDIVDSLAVSGIVLSADNLEPLKGMYVGLHSNLSDTAFTHTKFLRISRTNDYGKFTIRGVAPGKYHIFALDDKDRDYKYGNPAEGMAFMDSIIVPTSIRTTRNDTISHIHDDITIDSISTVEYTRFLPDNIVLRAFEPNFGRKYLAKYERNKNQVSLYFGSATEMPKVAPMSFAADKDWALMEKTIKNDTITYWIKDQEIADIDSLIFRVEYLKSDSLNQLVPTIDTLTFIDRNKEKDRREKEKKEKERNKKKKNKKDETEFLQLKVDAASSWDVNRPVTFEFGEPIADDLNQKLQFFHKIDTVFVPAEFHLEIDSLNPRRYVLNHKWEYGHEYRLMIDSAAVNGIYGLYNDKYETIMKLKKEDEYGKLDVVLSGIDGSVPAFVELLDKSDKLVKKSMVKNGAALFKNLNPNIYYARVVIDGNGNGVWDTGDYYTKQQPELVLYYDKSIEIKANWEITQPWAVDTVNIVGQKPLEITKNKPKDKVSRREQMEQRDNKAAKKQRDSEEQRRRETTNPMELNTGRQR